MAAHFARLAERLAPHGMATGYHNHSHEFAPLDPADGEAPWDTFFGHTPDAVIAQLDTGNAARAFPDAATAGAALLQLIERYPGRARSVHLKPYSWTAGRSDAMAGYRPLIGEDELPWEALFRACETVGGTELYVLEYESDGYPPLEAAERCLRAIERLSLPPK